MVQRRHFTNAIIQGSAVSNNYLFELAGAALDRIHPDLREAYGIMMVSSELGYWMFPQSDILAGAREKTHIGSSQVDVQQGSPVVRASGYCLPVLIQEIIKGLTELASMPSLPRDPVERQEVIDQADLVDLESWSMMLGPKLWDSFIEAVDAGDERELAMHLYRHIQTMDVDEFNAFMKEVLAKSPRGIQMLRDLATTIKAGLAQADEGPPMAESIVQRLIEDAEDNETELWKDLQNEPIALHPQFQQPPTGDRAVVVAYYVRRLGIGSMEVNAGLFHDGNYPYVTVEFTEGSGQSPLTAKFNKMEDAEKFANWIDELDQNRKVR